jgi:putative ABC transport system permease protein
MIASVLLAAGMGLLGGFLPAVRAARMSPIKAMRG